MPFKTTTTWVKPKLCLQYKGVKVWHAYKDDELDNGERVVFFNLTPYKDSEWFDVTELSTFVRPPTPAPIPGSANNRVAKLRRAAWDVYEKNEVFLNACKNAIRLAIDAKSGPFTYLENPKSECGNCNWVGIPIVGTEEIQDLSQRVDSGGPVPSGECPACGALCYEIKPNKKDKR